MHPNVAFPLANPQQGMRVKVSTSHIALGRLFCRHFQGLAEKKTYIGYTLLTAPEESAENIEWKYTDLTESLRWSRHRRRHRNDDLLTDRTHIYKRTPC